MATIYTMTGEILSNGLQPDSVCSEAMQAAKSWARDRGEAVRLEDGEDLWDVFPDGTVEEGESWGDA